MALAGCHSYTHVESSVGGVTLVESVGQMTGWESSSLLSLEQEATAMLRAIVAKRKSFAVFIR